MAMGNPIVASDVRGNNDLVKDGVNGYLVPLNDSEMMAQRIIELIENKELLDSFGKQSLTMVEKYGLDSVISQMLDIYKSLGIA